MTSSTASGPTVQRLITLCCGRRCPSYLGRYRGDSWLHTESDLRIFLRWCADQDLDPLSAVRADIERYLRWLQDVGRYRPSTVSRRLSVVVGFYRICIIREADCSARRWSPS
jgi:integrase/recombinase XerD